MLYQNHLPRIILFTIAVFAFASTSNAQNLLPNGSFEEGFTCPTGGANVTAECLDWYSSFIHESGLEATPEWFHECSELSLYSPPDVLGPVAYDLIPFEGGGYAGIAACNTLASDVRELIGVALTEPLTIGNSYLVEFQVSNILNPEMAVESNGLGFNFSTHPYYHAEGFPLNACHYDTPEVIPNIAEWLTISHVFTADSAYQYLHIGVFIDNDSITFNAPNPLGELSFYVVDAVSVSSTVGIGEAGQKAKVKIYPNPAAEVLNFTLPENQTINDIRVFDSMGNQVIILKDTENKVVQSLSVKGLNKGIYHLQIVTNQTIFYETFIKE